MINKIKVNGNSNIIVGAVNPNNKLNPLNQINQNMMNNNKIVPGNIDILQSQKNNENGERYIGQLVKGLRNGEGKVFYKNSGKLKFEGVFVNGIKHRKGKEYYENGEIKYEGIFINPLAQACSGAPALKYGYVNIVTPSSGEVKVMEFFMKEKEN